jgi:hypothetical protein
MRQVKSYVELQSYNEITSFAEAERVVSSYLITKEMGVLIGRLLADLAAPRSSHTQTQLPALHIITGQRGVGKTHLLTFIRSIIEVKALRGMIADSNILQAIGQFADKTVTTIDINFVGFESDSFANRLRQALCTTLRQASYYDDDKWTAAVQGEQVFEQAFGALPLGAQIILFIDGLSQRWYRAPEQVEADLDWLALIARQADALPLRAVIVREEEADHLENSDSAVYNIPANNLREIIARRVLKKTPQQLQELTELHAELMRLLPGFSWSHDDIAECYPLHPLIFECSAALRAAARSFSLPSFITASVPRVLSRPALSLITPDEVFDRYEYEFRKNEDLAPTMRLYDQIVTQAIAKLPVTDRLWAKLVLKTLFLYSLNGQSANSYQIAQAQILTEESNPATGYERVTAILDHFATLCPEAFLTQGGKHCSYILASANQTPNANLERQILRAAREITSDDPRLAELLLTQGLATFQDLQPILAFSSAQPLPPYFAQAIQWRGSQRLIDVCFNAEVVTESQWRLLIAPLSKLTVENPAENKEAEDSAGIENQGDDFTLTWKPAAVVRQQTLTPLKKLLALQAMIEARTASGMMPSDDLIALQEKLSLEVRALFVELYLQQGTLSDAQQSFPVAAAEMEREQSFQAFLTNAFDDFFSQHFSSHPDFPQVLTLEQADVLLAQFFIDSEEQRQTSDIQELAEQFALPLGLASNTRSSEPVTALYQPDVFSEAVEQRPFVQAVLGFIDQHAEETGLAHVPLILVERLLSDTPYGLQRAAQYLLFGALIATDLIELVDESQGHTLTKENLGSGFDLSAFMAVRRMTAISYPSSVLVEWARVLTGRVDLPAPNSSEEDKKIREALRHWLTTWQQEQLHARFEQLPMDMLTLSAWRALNTSKIRFSRISVLVEATIEGKMETKTALSRIADIFGLDRSSLIQMQTDMLELCGFLDWMPIFTQLRNYLLVVEPTSDPNIEELRTELAAHIQDSRTLLNAELRQELELKFLEFRKLYSEFYAAVHEAEVGPSANRQLIAAFCASPEWLKFCLLMELKLEGGAFDRDAQALLRLAQETRCDLPVLELLQHQPHCCCAFRLHRQIHLSSLMDALKSIVSAASTFYSLAIWRQRSELRAQVQEISDPAFQRELEDFLTACGNGDLSDLNADIVTFINECLASQASAVMGRMA